MSEVTLTDPIWRAFIGYATVLILKTLLMSFVTAYHRISKRCFATEEDTVYFGIEKKGVVLNNPSVERVRRAHQNDLENIPLFIILGVFYCTTGPALSTALLHFRVFTAARILHSIVYLLQVPQPARALTFFVGMFVNMSLVYHILLNAAF